MNLKIQKILAREFLVLMICIIISAGVYIYFSLSNYYFNNKIDKLNQKELFYKKIQDSLSVKFQLQSDSQHLLTNHVNNFIDKSEYRNFTNEELWTRLKYLVEVDSITIKWNTIWSYEKTAFVRFNFKSPLEFQRFIKNNIPDNSVIHRNDSLIENIQLLKVSTQTKLKSNSSKNEATLFAFYVALILFFGIRFLVLATVWSYKVIFKNNNI